MQVKVVKFGGSSLASAEQFKKVAEIIKADESRRYVVPSAPGKRFDGDEKITDMLYACYDVAADRDKFCAIFDRIVERYNGIIQQLNLNIDLTEEYQQIKVSFRSRAGRDYAASRGEYLNGMLLASYLGFDFINAADVIFFNEKGEFDGEKTNTILQETLKRHSHAVIPGFYGAMPNDTIKTFSRGGSDVTGSIVARACNADLYENWTDVSGFLMADPRIVENPKTIETISYQELRELSYMGATVLHEDAIFPVRKAGIPINIKNTNNPQAPGTMIVAHKDETASKGVITGIAGKKGFSVIHMEKDMMNSELGFGRRVLKILENNDISFEHIPSGIDTLSIVVATSALEGKREKIVQQIQEKLSPDCIDISDHLAIIAIVGKGMIQAKGTSAKVFGAIAKADVNIRMIDQGSGELNIIIGVDEKDFEKAIGSIYNAFEGING